MGIWREIRGNYRRYLLCLFDICFFTFVDAVFYVLSTVGYFSNVAATGDWNVFLINSLIVLVCLLLSRIVFGVYRTVWRYTSTWSYIKLILADAVGGIVSLLAINAYGTYRGLWHCVVVVALASYVSMTARMCYRMWYKRKYQRDSVDDRRRNAAIVGAGQLGTYLANDLRTNVNSCFEPKFFVDRDKSKVGNTVVGLPVYNAATVGKYIEKYAITDVIIAISNQGNTNIAQLYETYQGFGCSVKILDTLVNDGAEKTPSIREISIEDLLFRKPVPLRIEEVAAAYAGEVVMITGGGGSIGSELCRQIAACEPAHLVILDNYENNAYDIQQELIRTYGNKLKLSVEIASVRDVACLDRLFAKYRPDVVFQAAAHKHVPLMENSGYEAIKNNVFGTYNVANMAERYGVRKFVLISSDKAVNPTNVMGASKRLCEMVVQCRRDSVTEFCAVRFGNVLGSNGSVIPLFRKQIAAGGPITITDKRIIRYFMTIPEASQLVIRAGAMAKRGELFVLDMGCPVKIYDLAVNLIKLSGLTPEKDIAIVETGLRPGEKLYEELLRRDEELDKTENDLIFVERDTPLTREQVDEKIRILQKAAEDWDAGGNVDVRTVLKSLVPSFYDPEELNEKAEQFHQLQGV